MTIMSRASQGRENCQYALVNRYSAYGSGIIRMSPVSIHSSGVPGRADVET
jgi:hypothetical protein